MAELATTHDGESPRNSYPPQSKHGRGCTLGKCQVWFWQPSGAIQGECAPQKRKSPQSRVGFLDKLLSFLLLVIGRGERIRTSDPLLPKQMRYRTALRPEPTIVGDWTLLPEFRCHRLQQPCSMPRLRCRFPGVSR